MRFSSSVWIWGESEKRTDFEPEPRLPELERRAFLMEEEARFGAWEARSKSSFREGSLGCVIVEVAVLVGFPTNCAARSLY